MAGKRISVFLPKIKVQLYRNVISRFERMRYNCNLLVNFGVFCNIFQDRVVIIKAFDFPNRQGPETRTWKFSSLKSPYENNYNDVHVCQLFKQTKT